MVSLGAVTFCYFPCIKSSICAKRKDEGSVLLKKHIHLIGYLDFHIVFIVVVLPCKGIFTRQWPLDRPDKVQWLLSNRYDIHWANR